MKTIFLFLMLFSTACFGQTQSDINTKATGEYQKSDKLLNDIYQQIVKLYGSNSAFLRDLKGAQHLWVQLRDTQLKLKYPDREPGYYGSAHEMCRSIYLKELTDSRIKELQHWLEEPEEGDVCASTIGQYNSPNR